MNIAVHVYECEECILVFAVEMAFEDQSEICCPNCGNEDINDVAAGELNFQKWGADPVQANETSREELLTRDVKILFDENRRLKEIIKDLELQLKQK